MVVIGGGISGLAAALTLRDEGYSIVLVERRPFLGGRAYSFRDPDTGAILDNGQHVLVGACSRLRRFLSRIGSPPKAFLRQARLDIPIFDRDGRACSLRAAPLPPPFHLVPAFLRYRHLDRSSRVAVARAVRELVSTKGAKRESLDPVPLGAWLARRQMPEIAVQRFWEPLVRPALNVAVDQANTPLTAFFLEQALWKGRAGGALWLPTVGLSEAIGNPAERAVGQAGIDLRLERRVIAIRTHDDRISGVEMKGGEWIDASRVIVAVPPRSLDQVHPPTSSPRPDHEGELGSSAIINVYLWYDRPVAPAPFGGSFDPAIQWFFDRTRLLGVDDSAGFCLGLSLSAADDLLTRSKEALADHCDEAIHRAFPQRSRASRVGSAVVKEPWATFFAGPNLRPRRPGPRGDPLGLHVAGDWTDTGWPATMEGAVRSGEKAAESVIESDREAGSAS